MENLYGYFSSYQKEKEGVSDFCANGECGECWFDDSEENGCSYAERQRRQDGQLENGIQCASR